MPDPLARLDARARLARRIALTAALPPLACHLAAPFIGFDAAPAVAIAEVAVALALRPAGVPMEAIRIRPRRPAVPATRATRAVPA